MPNAMIATSVTNSAQPMIARSTVVGEITSVPENTTLHPGGNPPPPLWRFLTFTQNIGLQGGTAFSHAWSLCVEEQFYLVLPLVLAIGALCGLGGVTLGLNLATFDFTFGNAFLLIIVAAAVFGSVGQPYGAMVGAVVIGMASEISAIWAPSLKQVVAFAILVVVLVVRPGGLWRQAFTQVDVAGR